MKMDIKMPSVGESITGGIITSWLRQNGDTVKEGEIVCELETDKTALEVPSPASGILEILIEEETEVKVEQVIGTVSKGEQTPAEPVAAVNEQTAPVPSAPPQTAQRSADNRQTERVPMTTIRKKTAERLVRAQQTAAYLTTFNEIDMQKVVDIRTQHQAKFQEEHGIKIGFTSFVVKACSLALQEFPGVNARLEDNDIMYQYFCDIGVAVSIKEGLLVPVIRNADLLPFAGIEAAIADYAQRAGNKKIQVDELTGGTFTITNGGVFGSLMSTPIPVYPQTAILGMHAIKKRPVVIEDQIVIRPMMYVALSYDHRVIDGRQAIGFLAAVKNYIEEPDKLLLEL
jgi:2-oxoglutarate dehydrogenase E2 component (dihydrolipoamide succinyltransferase)